MATTHLHASAFCLSDQCVSTQARPSEHITQSALSNEALADEAVEWVKNYLTGVSV